MGKKIAVFSTAWNGEHIGSILKGIQQKTAETHNDLYIFNTYGGFEVEDEFNECEYNIFNLALQTEFDGALILSNNTDSIERIEQLAGELKRRNIPCINLEEDIPDLYFIGTNNYAAMETIMEHLVTVHNFKTFNYVGGHANHIENKQRKRAFLDVLGRHGIDIDEHRIRDYKFTRECGKKAFNDFYEMGLAFPDVVVCANDDMAIGYMAEAERHGYKVPDDFRITGFDNLSQAYCNIPPIASIGRGKEELGMQAVGQLLGLIEGKEYPRVSYIASEFSPNASCGCDRGIEYLQQVQKHKADMERRNLDQRWRINFMQKRLLACQSEKEFVKALNRERHSFAFEHLAIMVSRDEFDADEPAHTPMRKGYPKQMRVMYSDIITIGGEPIMLDTDRLVCDGYLNDGRDSHSFVFLPIHLRGRSYGYCMLEGCLDYIYDGNLFYWISVINAVIEHIRQNEHIRRLNQRLNRMYMQDSLTDIYNRFAIKNFGEPLLAKNKLEKHMTLFLFADLDGLKTINDTYGHEAGDAAIKAAAKIISQSCPDDTYVCIRYGGDEFLMIGTYREDMDAEYIKRNISQKIDEFNAQSSLPAKLNMSIGSIIASPDNGAADMEYYISKADAMMYRIKKERKAARE